MKIKYLLKNIINIHLIIILLAATGCNPDTIKTDNDLSANQKLIEQAERAVKRKDFSEAVKVYLDIADRLTSPESEKMKVKAALASLETGSTLLAERTYANLLNTEFARTNPKSLHFLQIKILYIKGDMNIVLQEIDRYGEKIDSEYAGEILKLRASIYEDEGSYILAASDICKLKEIKSETPETDKLFQEKIWDLLQHVSADELNNIMPPPPNSFGGWIELAYYFKQYSHNKSKLKSVISGWHQRYPHHSAYGDFIDRLINKPKKSSAATITKNPTVTLGNIPSNIGVLLPLSGKLRGPASSILDGIIAATMDMPQSERPVIRVYDSSDSPIRAAERAVAEGAEIIIGPLKKNAIIAINEHGISIPLLALNYISNSSFNKNEDVAENIIQFGLLPEHEAAEAARHAFADGHRSMLVLTPNDSWGQRIGAAFAENFRFLGGEILSEGTFDPDDTDLSGSVKMLLHYDKNPRYISKGSRVNQAVDAIFFGAKPIQARILRPLFNFYRAQNIPAYTVSRVYGGRPDPDADIDMKGVSFVDIPWMLSEHESPVRVMLANNYKGRMARYPRFFAVGIDSINMLSHIDSMQQMPGYRFNGHTGSLTVENGLVKRALFIAEFKDGTPEPRSSN